MVDAEKGWRPCSNLVALKYDAPFTADWELRHAISYGGRPGTPVLPIQPLSVRHFYGSERALIEDAYLHLHRILPPVASVLESLLAGARERVPALAGAAGPIKPTEANTAYRFDNPLAVVPTQSVIEIPNGTPALDYAPRLGFVLSKSLLDATPEEAEDAIVAFVLACEFTSEDPPERSAAPVQLEPPTSLAAIAVSADELIEGWRELEGTVFVNGQVVTKAAGSDTKLGLGELLSAASAAEKLRAGELFSVGLLNGAANARPLKSGDHLLIDVPGLGRLEHTIS